MQRPPVRGIIALFLLIGMTLACGEASDESAAGFAVTPESGTPKPISPVAAADTASAARRTAEASGVVLTPIAAATPTIAEAPAAEADSCLGPDAVTPEMNGELICVRGLITDFAQSAQVGTRYSFSDQPNSFFMFSNLWEITNSSTGKTVGVGTCVEVTGVVELQDGIPFMPIDDLITGTGESIGGFLIYDDPAACG